MLNVVTADNKQTDVIYPNKRLAKRRPWSAPFNAFRIELSGPYWMIMKRLFLVLGAWCLLVALGANAQTPDIISEPQSVTNNVASAADFKVVATNAATYQWYFQGMSLPGATDATLSLDDLSTNQAGSYTVVVTSSNNISVTSAPPAVLTLVPGTIIQWAISTYPNGGSSNFLVQLFDHDKPATVENFIHYITSGSYSNMFFDRDVTNFVLQGGDYVTTDRTTNGLNIMAVSTGTNVFPSQVDSEFSVGPLIHNRFGTIAMALSAPNGVTDTNSASSAFFFNLVDNSTNLDGQDFTVFGRILYGANSGSNVLQYFNTLSAPSNGIYDYSSIFYNIPTLPVNYNGTNAPTDANLFYCGFAFQTPPPVITNPPTISITFPTPNEVLTNVTNVNFTGTASDNVGGIAKVYYVVSALTGFYEGETATNAAEGTVNWSQNFLGFEPGVYEVMAYAQDGAGNLSAPATEYFTNLAVLTIITNVDGILTTNAPQYLVPGRQYSVTNEPAAGEQFVNWQIQGVVSLDPVQTFTAETNFTIEVTYVITNLPPGLAITSPAAGSVVPTTNAGLTIGGTIPSSITVTQLTVQLFSQSNAVTAALPAIINGANWSLAESNLAGGLYTIEVVAKDTLGQEGVVSENFTALVPPVIVSQPSSLTVNNGSAADFSVTASNAVSYQWYFQLTNSLPGATNATLALDNVSSNQSGSYVVVLTAPDGEMVTSAPAVLTIVQGTIIQWTISKYADGSSSNFLVELFDHDKPATVENFIHYVNSGAYSNVFFDTDAGSVLQGGNFVTLDRTTNILVPYFVSTGTNNFPSHIDSEFNLGPLIPNTYGTLASSGSGEAQARTGAFFFNLADNSTNFDSEGYTVFGRILYGTNAGSNILQYFNTLSPSNGLYDYTNYNLPNLPVNYDGTNKPKNDNVFFSDFKFQTTPPAITNPPAVSIAFPAPNAFFTNGVDLTVTGAASDNDAGLAQVFCVLTSSTGAYGGESLTNAADGTTNWSLDFGALAPGIYQLTAYAQDGAGNLSAPATVNFTNLAIITIITNLNGLLSTNAPQYLVPGQTNTVTAAPGPRQEFFSWTINGVTSLNPTQTFTVHGNLILKVAYLPTSSSTGLTIASPVSGANALAIQNVLTVSGTIASTNVSQLTCQFFINSNSISAALPGNIVGTNWSLTVTNYPSGSNYTVVALATNATGGSSFALANFTLRSVEILTLKTNGEGTIINTNFSTNSEPYLAPGAYTVKAVPAKGNVFYSWNDGFHTTLNPTNTFYLSSNLTLTATFVSEDASLTGLAITYPRANAMLTNGNFTNVVGTLPASLAITQLTCQIFLKSNGVTQFPQIVNIGPTGTKWTFPVTNLNAGPYTILAVAHDNKGNTRLISEDFNLLAKLSVGVHGQGTVTAGLNGKYLEVGKSYAISATAGKGQIFANWTGAVANSNSAVTAFVMSSNTVLTANFVTNLFPAVAGTYTGLFLDPAAVSPTNSGFVQITVSKTGAFSGNLMFPSVTYGVGDQFFYNGFIALQAVSAFNSNYLIQLVLSLDLTNGTDSITGYVGSATTSGDPIWESELVLYRAATILSGSNAPAAGKYVLLLQPEDPANAPGYAAISLAANGNLALAGELPDNTAISQNAKMSQDGIWPVYIVPSSYKGKGMVIGWQTNTASGECDGQLFWCKPGTGIASNLTSIGASFAPPVAGTQYQMVLAGGTSNSLTVSSAQKFVPQPPITAISLLPTGVLSGAIDLNSNKLSFKGAFVNPTNGGAGFIIGTNGQTQGFQIIGANN
jgi:cyclophilin family peptidyl-prolyl cis-trans isomerase